MSDATKQIKTLQNLLEIMTSAEAAAVARNVPLMAEAQKLQSENSKLRQRNQVLESAFSNLRDSATEILSIAPE